MNSSENQISDINALFEKHYSSINDINLSSDSKSLIQAFLFLENHMRNELNEKYNQQLQSQLKKQSITFLYQILNKYSSNSLHRLKSTIHSIN